MKIKSLIILVIVIGALLIPKFFCNSEKPMGGKPGAPKGPVKVSVYTVKQESVAEKFQLSGTLLPNEFVDIKPEAQGLIRKILFTEGAKVNKGQLLVKLNDEDFQTQLRKALANKKLKEDNVKRNEALLKKEAIAQADYDASVTELTALEADIAYLKEQIRKTEIKAPFSGTIGLRKISEGAFITPATSITGLQDISQMKLEFSVPEKYATRIQAGDVVSFKVNNLDETFTAKIYATDAALANNTRSITMRAICQNKNDKLLPGLFASINITLENNGPVFLIPTQSVIPVLKGQKVFVVKGDSAIEVPVKTGFRTDQFVSVTSGLQEGDQVIVEGIMYVKPGAKVTLNRK